MPGGAHDFPEEDRSILLRPIMPPSSGTPPSRTDPAQANQAPPNLLNPAQANQEKKENL